MAPAVSPMSGPPGVHVIDASYGAPLTVYLVEGERLTLIDAGIATTPEQHILPFLDDIGAGARDVEWNVSTHAHHDHVGGNAAMLAANPALKLAIGTRDAGWAESPRRYMAGLYGSSFAGVWDPPAALDERVHKLFPAGVAVDRALDDGDALELGAGRRLRVIDAPAHSPGHVLLHDEDGGALFAGDAIQGRGNDIGAGGWLFPLYTSVDAYLESLQRIRASGARWICTAHYGVLEGAALQHALTDAEAFVTELDALLSGLLARHDTVDLARAVAAVVEHWPRYDAALQVHATCAAHLDRMVAAGTAKGHVDGDVKSWAAVGG